MNGFPQVDIVIVYDLTEGKEVNAMNKLEQNLRNRSDSTTLEGTPEYLQSSTAERHDTERREYWTDRSQVGSQTLPTVETSPKATAKTVGASSANKNTATLAEKKETSVRFGVDSRKQGVEEGRVQLIIPATANILGSPSVNDVTSKTEKPARQTRPPHQSRKSVCDFLP